MNPDGGYTRSYRRMWSNPVFRTKQEAAVFAWMRDMAQWRDSRISTRFGPVDLKMGELLVAERALADDFGLHRNTVRTLLQRMVDDGMITVFRDRCPHRAGTVVHLTNYSEYQGLTDQEAARQDQKTTEKETEAGPKQDRSRTKNKEGKESKEVKDSLPSGAPAAPAPQEGIDLFGVTKKLSPRQALWASGLPILAALTGKTPARCRALLGRLLAQADDDCALVLEKLTEGQARHPMPQAEAWLMRACEVRRAAAGKPRLGDGSWMASDPVLSQLYQSRPAAAAAPGRPAEPFIDSTYEELP